MTTLASWKRGTKAGDVLLCVENTYRPEINGTRRYLNQVGPSVVVCTLEDQESRNYRMEWPKASDVLSVTDEEITYKIGIGDHTVTLRRVA